MARFLLLLCIWTLQAGLIGLLVDADWVERQMNAERALVQRQFGAEEAALITERVRSAYREWFVANGLVQSSYARLLPDPRIPARGMEGLAPWFFQWLERRINAFWWLMFEALCRMQLLRAWSAYLAVLALAACIDGLVHRQIHRVDHGYASGDRYLIARRALLVLAIAPAIYLSAPITIPPVAVPLWGVMFALCLSQLAAHTQHRV
jgi:hypothetical protein